MTIARYATSVLPAMGIVMLALAAPAVVRAETINEDFYSYHRMVHAAAVCKYPGLDIRAYADSATTEDKMAADAAQERIAEMIEERVAADLSASDKLFNISNARGDVNEMIRRHGCDGTDTVALVSSYDEQIGVVP